MKASLNTVFDTKAYAALAVILIIFSVLSWTIEEIYPSSLSDYQVPLDYFQAIVLGLFTVEYVCRAAFAKSSKDYLLSQEGLIDFLSIAPSMILLITGLGLDSIWLRLLRLARFMRVFALVNHGGSLGGIVGSTMPLVAMAILSKLVIIAMEQYEFWVVDSSINILIGVSGFSIAILMGSKLSTVNGRLYDLEDTVCRLVGGMRDMWWANKEIRPTLGRWSAELETFLLSPREVKLSSAGGIRKMTDELEAELERLGIGGPNTSGFHRDAAFLIHRATATTPFAYNQFLKYVSILYVVILIASIPGVVGLISVILSAFVIGGIYLLVADLDDPLSYSEDSFIDARLDALKYWNEQQSLTSSPVD